MRKLQIAICEDDVNTLDLISSSILTVFGKHNVAVELTPVTAADQLRREMGRQHFDLLFLDIQMPKQSGIEFAARLRAEGDQTAIIYVSSREDKVFDALTTQPFGFVRKGNFLQDIVSVIERFLASSGKPEREKPVIVLQQKNGVFRIAVEDICYLEGSGKNQLLYCEGKQQPVTLHSTMNALEEELTPYGFIRVHKGFLVNHLYITAILPNEVKLADGTMLPLSRRRGQEIREQYLDLLKERGSLLP